MSYCDVKKIFQMTPKPTFKIRISGAEQLGMDIVMSEVRSE
jgi:hypothetical protein